MSTQAISAPARRSLTLDYQHVVNAVFATFVFFGMLSLIEPSPYDFLAVITIPVWFVGGFKLHRALMPILLLWILFEASGFLALMPTWDQPEPRTYQLQSLYLFATVVFFTIFFSERTIERGTLCLKAFTAGCIVSSIIGLIGYLDIAGLGASLTTVESRVSGTFKDPNVFGSYLVLAAAYLIQIFLLGTTRRTLVTFVSLSIVLVGVFISYSRGSWGAALGAMTMTALAGYATADSRQMRRRIVRMSVVAAFLGALGLGGALSVPDVRDFFFERAEVAQSYDAGVTGRFGNQLRSIPMLIERPGGFGPLQYRRYFDLDPHNSYIGAFANDGWLGGFAWIAIVLTSSFVAVRLMFAASPYRRLAQVFGPALIVLLLQGFQIDVDHWRQVFLCFGAIWGIEAARLRWLKAPGAAGGSAVAHA